MDLLQHLVDVDAVAFLPLALLLLIALGDGLLGFSGLLGGLSGGLWWHAGVAMTDQRVCWYLYLYLYFVPAEGEMEEVPYSVETLKDGASEEESRDG